MNTSVSKEANPLVSVISPVYNEERHIDAMISSVLNQSYPHWELVIVDDGSTDATVNKIDSYAQVEERVRLIHRGKKLGKVRAFNAAFEACRGDIVCCLGGDDMARSHAMASRVDALRDHLDDLAVAYFHLNMFKDNPDRGVVVPRGADGSRSGGSTTVTRPLAEKIFPIPESLPAEDPWFGQVSQALAEHIVHSPEVVIDYRQHAGNSNPSHESFEEMSDRVHRRRAFAPLMLADPRFDLDAATREDLERRWAVEQLRNSGSTWAILLRPELRIIDRLAIASKSNRYLWRLRWHLGRSLNGWRER